MYDMYDKVRVRVYSEFLFVNLENNVNFKKQCYE